MQKYIARLLLVLMLLPGCAASAEVPAQSLPEWFLAHIEFLTQGRWITDNSPHKSEDEPFDAYGMEYEKGLGGKSVRGRLFGLVNGKEVATFWEFHTVWHPGNNRVIAYQFGSDGTFAEGPLVATGKHTQRMEQVFYRPDGQSWKSGHETEEAADGTFITQSFDIGDDGAWRKGRLYIWSLQK